MDRNHSSVNHTGSCMKYIMPNFTQLDAWQRCPALIVLKEEKTTTTLEINCQKPYVNNIANGLFDVCKQWMTDQSQRSISEISVIEFQKIEHVLNCEIKFRNLFISKADRSH